MTRAVSFVAALALPAAESQRARAFPHLRPLAARRGRPCCNAALRKPRWHACHPAAARCDMINGCCHRDRAATHRGIARSPRLRVAAPPARRRARNLGRKVPSLLIATHAVRASLLSPSPPLSLSLSEGTLHARMRAPREIARSAGNLRRFSIDDALLGASRCYARLPRTVSNEERCTALGGAAPCTRRTKNC